MVSLELKTAFDNMELDDKKNKLNEELLVIGELIKKIESFYGIDSDFKIKNYDIKSQLRDDELLTFLYEDVFEIQRQLLLIIANLKSDI